MPQWIPCFKTATPLCTGVRDSAHGEAEISGGTRMNRFMAFMSVGFVSTQLMGCGQLPAGPDWTLLSNGLGGPVEAAGVENDQSAPEDLHAPTVANKTLSALALERTTGLKPVPSRLVKFD